jgi:hypothetical protein
MENFTIIPLSDDRQARFSKLECDDIEKKLRIYYRIEKVTSTGFVVEDIKYYDLALDKFDFWNATELGQGIRVALASGILSDLNDNNIK